MRQEQQAAAPPTPTTGTTGPASTQPLPETLRSLLRHVPNPVVICTSAAATPVTAANHISHHDDLSPAPPPPRLVPIGLTMSSFTSLSLYPTPLVTFNIAVPSRTEAAIASSGRFMIHVLTGDAHGTRLAELFRRGNDDPARTLADLNECGARVVGVGPLSVGLEEEKKGDDDDDGLGCEGEGLDALLPFLDGRGVAFVLACRLAEQPAGGLVRVRDHVIVVGEVEKVIKGEDFQGHEGEFGLLYGDRQYRYVGEPIG